MPRSVQITVSPDRTENLVADIQKLKGLIGLRVQRGISIFPPGDLISVEVTTLALHEMMHLLDQRGIGMQPDSSAVTSSPLGVVSASHAEALATDTSEALWEEIELTIGEESNMTANGLLLMSISGIIAAIGISTDALHLVIGAMVIAPGFEPISRISLGAVAGGGGWRRGIWDTFKGYVVLAIAAGVTAFVLRKIGISPLGGSDAYLPAGSLSAYWTSITIPGLIATAVASVAGALLLAANRPVLTAGVMIALALIPTAAMASMALVVGDMEQAGKALLRWGIDAGSVALFSALVFLWKRASVHRRNTRI